MEDRVSKCPVCLATFQTPKSLQCGHSVCDGCCQQLKNGNSINCPACRQVTPIPTRGLPTNFVLRDLIQQCSKKRPLEKPYQCSRCSCVCTAEEAWVLKNFQGVTFEPYCSHCLIKYSDPSRPDHIPLERTNAQSIADLMASQKNDFEKVTSVMRHARVCQERLSKDAKEIMETMRKDIIRAMDKLEKDTLSEVSQRDEELDRLNTRVKDLKMPETLQGVSNFQRAYQSVWEDLSTFLSSHYPIREKTMSNSNSLRQRFDQVFNADGVDASSSKVAKKQK